MNKNLIFLLIYLILNSCGYKVVTQSQKQNFQIVEIETSGDKKLNFYLKNKLNKIYETSNLSKIAVEIFSKKQKTVKEKNINNEITQYEILIEINTKINFLDANKKEEFTLLETGSYDVGDIHSQTLTNEKKIIKLLTENISKELINKIILLTNDI